MTLATDLFLFTKMIMETEMKTADERQQLSSVQQHEGDVSHVSSGYCRHQIAPAFAGFIIEEIVLQRNPEQSCCSHAGPAALVDSPPESHRRTFRTIFRLA